MELHQKQKKRLVEVCPQCCKSIDSSANRLVQDTCGHPKCRICLLQEITGCLLCVAENRTASFTSLENTTKPEIEINDNAVEIHPRKSVITSLAIQIAEQKQHDDVKSVSPSLSPVDKDTHQLFKQSLEKDILFPTEIVQRSAPNFYHLKRVFSERFFNENKNLKHKACETEERWTSKQATDACLKAKDNEWDKKDWKIPNHIQIQYHCTIHKVSFQQKHNIMRHHMMCNLEDEPAKTDSDGLLQCKVCSKKYRALGKLNRHMKVHTKVTKFKCSTCGKFCTDNYALKTHERIHTKQKPYTCRYCDRNLSSLHNFKRHEKQHRDERKFPCPISGCKFRFITKTELTRHSVTHSKVKAFECQDCGARFAFQRTLARHSKSHMASQVAIECQYCGSAFKRKDNLERHVKNAHQEHKSEQA